MPFLGVGVAFKDVEVSFNGKGLPFQSLGVPLSGSVSGCRSVFQGLGMLFQDL